MAGKKMMTRFIDDANLTEFLSSLKNRYLVYSPQKEGEHYFLNRDGDFTPSEFRTLEPVKSLYLYPRGKVYPGDSEKEAALAILGVKSCDLFSLKIQDYIFQESLPPDPFYSSRREKGLIISSDCISPKKTCFCAALNISPYPETGFDLNLSPLSGGFLVEVGSSKGEELIKEQTSYFQEPQETQLNQRRQNRDDLLKKFAAPLIPQADSLQELVKKGLPDVWEEMAERCVECGNCNFVCPTCHCFLLAEEVHFEKFRLWDSCQFPDFARVAGGGNPLDRRSKRLRNRYLHKFDFFKDVLGYYGCSGCGRCIEACLGGIDLREVLSRLEESLSSD
ncbi:MAG: 4Fe-4S dicluster domain-containing protein [bacterium]|nr:4Fe-4S dicluster domain-containing protein [bacterium]